MLIRGIDNQPDGHDESGLHSYAHELVAMLHRHLSMETGGVAFQSLYWVSVLDARELDYLKRIERKPLGWHWLRRAATLFLGDAGGCQKISAAYDTTCQQVHQRVRSGITALRARVGSQTPLAILVRSLDGHIVSSFAWDQQKLNRMPSCSIDPSLDLEALAGLITFGCNIPLFTFAYEKICSTRSPGHCLAPAIRQQAHWLSVCTPTDPLSYPLRPLQNYAAVVHEDLVLLVGPWCKRHTPLSYMRYWSNACSHDCLADYPRRLLVVGLEPADVGCTLPTGEPGDWPPAELC